MPDIDLALARMAEAADVDGFGAHSLIVQIGDAAAEHHWHDDVRRDIHSAAKAVCVLAAGIAADEGLVDVDRPVSVYLPGPVPGEGVESVTLRHLLTMTSGIDLPWSPTMMTDWPDLAVELLGRPSRGRVFQYSNASTYTAMRALAAVVGDLPAWLAPRLFEPLGIDDVTWRPCPGGWVLAGEGLELTAVELSRIGRLIRDRGAWDGYQLISPTWVDAMHTDWVETGGEGPYARYAMSGWDGPGPAWREHGAHGQLLIFVDDAVVTITADDHLGADRMAERVVEVLTS